ncbi:protein of unknown function [Xenorhabdus nematophila AN6/1]|nr:hypothetical protein XNW1_1820002 [Xenorhabdus nematophila str. Websteri]CEF34241.1 hypothetical protein XNW1_880002 [Xenorhabdus nematophila str. Websteri]CEK23433.1 protein of unknown function [Xenorhabdus nematophila AN6/1]
MTESYQLITFCHRFLGLCLHDTNRSLLGIDGGKYNLISEGYIPRRLRRKLNG